MRGLLCQEMKCQLHYSTSMMLIAGRPELLETLGGDDNNSPCGFLPAQVPRLLGLAATLWPMLHDLCAFLSQQFIPVVP